MTTTRKIMGIALSVLVVTAGAGLDARAGDAPLPNNIPAKYTGKPELGKPLDIPGTIPAIDYDDSLSGQNNVTFHYDGDPKKTQYRTSVDSIGVAAFGDGHVSVKGVPEDPDQVYLGWTQPFEWLKYTVRIKEAGTYVIGGKFAAGSTGATLTFSFAPELSTDEIVIPTTAGFQPGVEVYHVWEKVDNLTVIDLPAGIYVMKVQLGKIAGLNLESYTFTKLP